MYRLMGFGKPVPDNPSKARAKASVQMQLREFTNSVRGVVQRALYEEEQRDVFKPLHITSQKFLGLALRGKYQAPSFMVVMDEDMRKQIQLKLIQLGHRISSTQVERFIQGEIPLLPNLPNLRGRAGWDSKLSELPGLVASKQTHGDSQVVPLSSPPSYPFCLSCPECNGNVLSNNKAFQQQDLDKVCKCNQCKQNIKVRDWNCRCGRRWHLCHFHSSLGNSNIAKSTPTDKPCRGTKRAIGPFTHEKLVEIDTKRARRRPPNILPPAHNILSVKLRERFAHLLSR